MNAIWGVVKNGLVIPQTPLPEGARVQIVVDTEAPALPPDLQAEFDAWALGSGEALAAFERQLDADASHAQG
ncbi:MAG: hypothetical protein L0Y71_24645 [Gemmataceae bacterium]|nr:hypothetical protein [Gemmataceae bacterium]